MYSISVSVHRNYLKTRHKIIVYFYGMIPVTKTLSDVLKNAINNDSAVEDISSLNNSQSHLRSTSFS